MENCPDEIRVGSVDHQGGTHRSQNEKPRQQFLALIPKGICAKNKQACRVEDKHASIETNR
jgi:hypothetical protein